AVDDVRVRQPMGAGDDALPGLDRRERAALLGEPGAGGAVDGSRHAAARHQLCVRRVDYGVDVRLVGDVTLGELDRDTCDDEPAGHWTAAPAAVISDSARSPSPGCSSTGRVASLITAASKPSLRASSTVSLTHTSCASPTTTTRVMPRSFKMPSSSVADSSPLSGSR